MRRLPHAATAALLVALAGCATSPTGQPQLRLFPDEQMAQMGATAFEETSKEHPAASDPAVRRYVECVASAVALQANSQVQWEIRVFESEQVNAFALPGGKIGVYTGLLGVAETPDQLATVLGHEVAHVTAEHGNARVSTAFATQAGLQLVQTLAGQPTPMKQQLLGLLGLGAQYGVLLPYGRAQETEADVLGLDLMARAGFDPRASVTLWQNMGKASGGRQPPAFLSTHPAHQTRIQTLQRRMPQALALQAAARQAGRSPSCR